MCVSDTYLNLDELCLYGSASVRPLLLQLLGPEKESVRRDKNIDLILLILILYTIASITKPVLIDIVHKYSDSMKRTAIMYGNTKSAELKHTANTPRHRKATKRDRNHSSTSCESFSCQIKALL